MLASDLVAYERHSPVMRPGEGGDRGAPVVDELDAPPPLVLDPYKDDPSGVAGGELLVGLVPLDHGYLRVCNVRLLCKFLIKKKKGIKSSQSSSFFELLS